MESQTEPVPSQQPVEPGAGGEARLAPEAPGRGIAKWALTFLLGVVTTVVGLVGWRDSFADTRIEVRSMELVRANISLKSLESLPEYSILRYNFMRDEIRALRELAEYHEQVEGEDSYEEQAQAKLEFENKLLFSLLAKQISLDKAARSEWIDSTIALSEESNKAAQVRADELNRIKDHVTELADVLGGGATVALSKSSPFAGSYSSIKSAHSGIQLEFGNIERAKQVLSGTPEDATAQDSLAQAQARLASHCDYARVSIGYQACDAILSANAFPQDCVSFDFYSQPPSATCIGDAIQRWQSVINAEIQSASSNRINVLATRKKIAEEEAKADPQYIQISASVRNTRKGITALGTSATMRVFVGFAQDFTVEMTLVTGTPDIGPEAYETLVYRSKPWDTLSTREQGQIETWWNKRVPAVLLVKDNNGGVLWSQQYLFGGGQFDDGDASAAIRLDDRKLYAVHGDSWSPWQEWARGYGVAFAVLAIAVAATLLWAARYVFIRRKQLWNALTSAVNSRA